MAQIDVAKQVWATLKGYGYAEGPIAGILGNMQAESGLIADRWQSDKVGNMSGGYGLVQWTPATKLINWANDNGLNYRTVDTQCRRIKWEVDNKQQWIRSGQTFLAWFKSNIGPETAADDFVRYYERPAVINSSTRQGFARNWYNQLHGTAGTTTPAPTPAPSSPAKLTVDGLLGPATIKRWQQVMGTTADGVISKPSALVKAVQTRLNSLGCRDWDGKALVVDGIGIYSNLSAATAKSRTQWALQVHLGTSRDGILSKPSACVKALQTKLNANTF